MHSSAVLRRAIACALALSCGASLAQTGEQILPRIDVTGARFASDPSLLPIGASVITAAEIRSAGVADVNEAIRKIGGVYGRQSLDGSSDFTLDLRGFGENSAQNMVVMLDGVRLNESDLSPVRMSSIPIESVERIEIIRGGSSVLHGGGATGGVIQIVTRAAAAGQRTRGSLRVEAGQFGLADMRAALSGAWGNLALDAAVGARRTGNYRDHNDFEQRNFNGGAQWKYQRGRAGVRVDAVRQDALYAGSLSLEQFEADPRQASTPRNDGSLESDQVTAFIEHRIGTLDLAAELSRRNKNAQATYFYGDDAYHVELDSRQTQFSPRLRHLADVNGVLNELVAGIDVVRWNASTANSEAPPDYYQHSRAAYLRDEVKFGGRANLRLAAGVRRELVDTKLLNDRSAYQQQNAWDLQASADAAAGVNLFAKMGRSFRVPTVDEITFGGDEGLRIQTSRDIELGARLGGEQLGGTLRLFRHRLEGEIYYDPTATPFGLNVNLQPTERQGVELDGRLRLSSALALSGAAQHLRARFVGGANGGRELVLVPKNVASVRMAWTPGSGHSADAGLQWVDSQRYGGDFGNTCDARIPSYVTLDARYARRVGPWEFAVAGTNLADRQHFSQAFACRGGIYPGDGRQLKLSLRYDFQ